VSVETSTTISTFIAAAAGGELNLGDLRLLVAKADEAGIPDEASLLLEGVRTHGRFVDTWTARLARVRHEEWDA
jgi:hypothetical protein